MNVPSATAALRHHEIALEIERMREWADEIGLVPLDIVRRRLTAANELIMTRILPHAFAEKEILYPALKPLIGAQATAMLQRDHTEMLKLAGELNALRREATTGEIGPRFVFDARRVLYCLHLLACLYFAKEDEIVIPLLDARCTLAEAEELSAAMERAVARIAAEA